MRFAQVRGRTSAVVTALVCLTGVLSGCAPASPDAAGERPATDPVGTPARPSASTTSLTAPGTPTSSAPAAEQAAFTVTPPGPRAGAITGADMLVFDKSPLASDVVRRIKAVDGVQTVTPISLAQVSLENKVYNVAAVDPATYRLLTPADSADFQEQWDRVAGGELAVAPSLRDQLPLDKSGYLTLEVDGREQRVHVGAYAEQAGNIDMVVNEKLGRALGMQQGNALLLSTGEASPASLRKPIDRILGQGISVQNLDAVARYGLDPDVFQTAVIIGTLADAVGTYNYTPIGGGRVAPDPAWVASHIVTRTVPILGSVTCNKYLFPQLEAALGEVVTEGLSSAIHVSQYGGCYNARFIAGTTTLSNHSFGLAIDLNVPENQRGTVGQMDRGVVAIFKRWGFTWGGDWHYTDPMHFELNHLVRPGG